MSKVDEALVEINSSNEAIAAPHEGLRDYDRLNISGEAASAIDQLLAVYTRRAGLLTKAKAALTDLASDGHPTLPMLEIPPEALAELKANADTIAAALTKFVGDRAASLNLTADPPVQKT